MYVTDIAIIIVFALVILTNADDTLPPYEIRVWDKNQVGGLQITGSNVQCTSCFWYYNNVYGSDTPASNNTVLHLNQESPYGEYYLFDDQRQSVEEYELVVPNSNAGNE